MSLGVSWGGVPLDLLAHEVCCPNISACWSVVEIGVIVSGSPGLPFFIFLFAGFWHQELKVGMSATLWDTRLAFTASDLAMA